jgi:hypothetical protein
MKFVFFDTEFTELGIDPRLISIGLVSDDGEQTFYAELSDTYNDKHCSDFARVAVLPKLQGGQALMSLSDLTLCLGDWLAGFDEPVRLATDSLSWDWPWIHEIFYESGTWPENLDRQPELLKQEPSFNQAVEDAFATGLRRHHSLDDAKANRLAWLTVVEGFRESIAKDLS